MRGFYLTVIREVPASTTYFVSFEFICNSMKHSRDQCSVTELLTAGGVAGCLSWLFTYPIDVVKTRYQLDNSYKGMFDCAKRTFISEGSMGFWRGLTPTLLRYSSLVSLFGPFFFIS
jgi:solute carrier family 25 carnitine/acylcarnitine transporter 20/29